MRRASAELEVLKEGTPAEVVAPAEPYWPPTLALAPTLPVVLPMPALLLPLISELELLVPEPEP